MKNEKQVIFKSGNRTITAEQVRLLTSVMGMVIDSCEYDESLQMFIDGGRITFSAKPETLQEMVKLQISLLESLDLPLEQIIETMFPRK